MRVTPYLELLTLAFMALSTHLHHEGFRDQGKLIIGTWRLLYSLGNDQCIRMLVMHIANCCAQAVQHLAAAFRIK